jgi:hypothetical protein
MTMMFGAPDTPQTRFMTGLAVNWVVISSVAKKSRSKTSHRLKIAHYSMRESQRFFYVPKNSNIKLHTVQEHSEICRTHNFSSLAEGWYCWLENRMTRQWITAGPFDLKKEAKEQLRLTRSVNPVLG